MAAASVAGGKFEILVIGKSATQQCFKHVKKLSCRYRHQKKIRMTSELFEELVRKLDRQFYFQERKIVQFLHNCPANLPVEKLTNMNLFFTI